MPLLFSDTFDYLAQAQVAGLRTIRPPAYGLMLAPLLALPGGASLWWVVAAQALVTAWLIRVAVEVLAPGRWHALGVTAVLAVLTPLPWFVCWVMPDLMTGWLALAAALLCARLALPRATLVGLAAVLAAAIAVHTTHLPLALGLALGMGALAVVWRAVRPAGVAMLLLAAMLATGGNLLANRVITGQAVLSHGSSLFLGARLAELGLLQAELARRCPDEKLFLCGADIPTDIDTFLWGETSPVWARGDFLSLEDELAVLNRAAIAAAPGTLLAHSLPRAARQFLAITTADGMDAGAARAATQRLAGALPDTAPRFLASRQWQDGLVLPGLFAVHQVAAAAGFLALLVLRLRPRPDVVAAILLALVGNAVLIGLFGAVHPRYQARLVWLVPLLALLGWLGRRTLRR
jgi:hypothetical protein